MNTVTPAVVDPIADGATHTVTEYVVHPPGEFATAAHESEAITPEIVAVIQASAEAFLGTKIRILSVKLLPEFTHVSHSWSEKGRDIVHSSHNTVQRGH